MTEEQSAFASKARERGPRGPPLMQRSGRGRARPVGISLQLGGQPRAAGGAPEPKWPWQGRAWDPTPGSGKGSPFTGQCRASLLQEEGAGDDARLGL